ncbi:hypothetical protein [Anaerosporobacter sp.]
MFKTKLTKILTTCLVSVFILGAASISVHAETVSETEPNDTIETAQTITANNETAQGAAEGTYAGQYVVNGYSSTTDLDWYKVYLSSGTKYITCNDNAFEYLVADANGNTVFSGTYVKSGFGPTAYEFNVASSGYYYVRIKGSVSSSESYLFLIGSPTYSVASCDIPCREGTISMTKNGGTKTAHFDGASVAGVPKGAIAYSVSMSGVKTTSVSSINLVNNSRGLSFSLSTYTWDKNKLASMNLPVGSTWTASFGYNKVTSFTPVLKVYYAYPVYSTMVQ